MVIASACIPCLRCQSGLLQRASFKSAKPFTSRPRGAAKSRSSPAHRRNKHFSSPQAAAQQDLPGAQTQDKPVYRGIYSDWTVEDQDVREVIAYRVGLNVAALALLVETAIVLTSADSVPDVWQNAVVAAGVAGLGVSLYLVHMYVTPIKRFMQGLYGVGAAGAVGLALTQGGQSVPQYVAEHPSSVWLVGPFFAAVTGLAFKEGACYGKPEAIALFFVTPVLLLGHLTGLLPQGGEKGLLLTFVALCTIFAARKWTQAIKDDIGDKSVFMYQALPIEEQQQLDAQRSIRH
ncbi:hypothetical protein WJX77_002626 [Trebouxia sp. C0004]